mgnify:CR=1 FL=1
MFVSKAGEAFNANPIFVFDKTVEAAIQVAKEQHDAYEMSQGRKEDGVEKEDCRFAVQRARRSY